MQGWMTMMGLHRSEDIFEEIHLLAGQSASLAQALPGKKQNFEK